jgi:glycosyltransferase involved in cell wall biosynthesis
MWDVRTAHGVDNFLACSAFVARRIRKVYGRDATVVYPPVDTARFTLRTDKEDFYLAASRMVPYKRMPMIAEAFAAMPDKRLVIIGDGPELERVKFLSRRAPNILVMGYQPPEVLADHMGRARAFIFAAQEDFGIAPVEAQACGTPVIAYGAGGVLETVVSDPDPQRRTGLFFHQQTAAALCDAVREFEALGEFKPEVCRLNAERFSHECFQQRLRQAIGVALTSAPGHVAENPSLQRAVR